MVAQDITPAMIDDHRRNQESRMPATCTVTRSATSYATDGTSLALPGSGTVISHPRFGDELICRYVSLGTSVETNIESVQRTFGKFMLTVPWDADIKAQDSVTIGAKTYTVDGVYDGGPFATAIQAMMTLRVS